MTVADVFDDMNVLDNELDSSAGGSDESRSIDAVAMAVRYCYTVAASIQGILGTVGPGPVKTTALKETTLKPDDLLRVDSLWAIDATTKLPVWKLQLIGESGGHMPTLPWPLNWAVMPTNGQPFAYTEDAASWYWTPVPDAAYDTRVYGLWLPEPPADRDSDLNLPGAAGITLRASLAAFALKYLTMSVDDSVDTLQAVAVEMFTPALRALKIRDRSRPKSRTYVTSHST